MEILLKNLKIENFKGIKNLEIDFEKETNISGDNATGKTTVFDAYSWLLWDKDSQNRQNFNIKPFDENGENIHGIESSVEGILEINNKELLLKKVYKEIWTKKRGQLQETFTGNTTDYFINEVPVKKSEYNKKISEIVSESEFNLLANPLYFNAILDRKDRRHILISLIDEVDSKAIIERNKELEKLDLENYSIDELKAMAKASSRKINKSIESLPARIDELEKSKNDFDFSKLEKDKKKLEKEIKDIDKSLMESNKISDVIVEKNSEIQDLIDKKNQIKNEVDEKNYKAKREAEKELESKKEEFEDSKREVRRKLISKESEYDDLQEEVIRIKERIERLKKDVEKKRQDWISRNSEQFDKESLACPTCHREYEKDKQEKLIAHFNKHKSEELTEIQKDAETRKLELEEAQKELKEKVNQGKKLQEEVVILDEEYQNMEFKDEIKEIKPKEYPKEYFDIDTQIEAIKKELESISSEDNSELINKKQGLQQELNQVISDLALKNQNKELDKRIDEYKKQEKELARMYEEQQEILYLCDEYIRIYTDLIQDEINGLFSFVKFRLFEKQVNGDLKETAEVMVDGVPYSDVNNAGKINAGIDVINTLSKKLDIKVPIFVDNAESVNDLAKTDSQLVRLIVSKDKELKIK